MTLRILCSESILNGQSNKVEWENINSVCIVLDLWGVTGHRSESGLTLCILIDFPIHIDTISMRFYFKGSQVDVSKLWFCCLFVWFDSLRPINNLSVMKGRVFLGWTSTKLGLMCLAQGHNTVMPVRLEPAAPRSRVKHSTTEPLPSLYWTCDGGGHWSESGFTLCILIDFPIHNDTISMDHLFCILRGHM